MSNAWVDSMLMRVCGIHPHDVRLPRPAINFAHVEKGCRQDPRLLRRWDEATSLHAEPEQRNVVLHMLAIDFTQVGTAAMRRHFYDNPAFWVGATLGDAYAESIAYHIAHPHTSLHSGREAHPTKPFAFRYGPTETLLLLASFYTKCLRKVQMHRERSSPSALRSPEELALTHSTAYTLLLALTHCDSSTSCAEAIGGSVPSASGSLRHRACTDFNTFVRAFCVPQHLGKIGLKRVVVRGGTVNLPEGESDDGSSCCSSQLHSAVSSCVGVGEGRRRHNASDATKLCALLSGHTTQRLLARFYLKLLSNRNSQISCRRRTTSPSDALKLSTLLASNAAQRLAGRAYLRWARFAAQNRSRRSRRTPHSSAKLCLVLSGDTQRRLRGRAFFKWLGFPSHSRRLRICQRGDGLCAAESDAREALLLDEAAGFAFVISQHALLGAMVQLLLRRRGTAAAAATATPPPDALSENPRSSTFVSTLHSAMSADTAAELAAIGAAHAPRTPSTPGGAVWGSAAALGGSGNPATSSELSLRALLECSRQQEASIGANLDRGPPRSFAPSVCSDKGCGEVHLVAGGCRSAATSPLHRDLLLHLSGGLEEPLSSSVAAALCESESISRIVLASAAMRERKGMALTASALALRAGRAPYGDRVRGAGGAPAAVGAGGAAGGSRGGVGVSRVSPARSIQLLPVAT